MAQKDGRPGIPLPAPVFRWSGELPDKWIVAPRPNRAPQVRLICVPYAGAGISAFRGWAERVRTAEVGIVQLPGRDGRLHEPLLRSVTQACDGVTDALASLPVYPTVLFGHGLGALIAFETARRLQERRWPLLALFVSGCRAPALPKAAPGIADLPAEAFIPELRRRFGSLPDEVFGDQEMMPLLLAALRADCAIQEDYRYEERAPLGCPLIACGGAADPQAPRTGLDAWRRETRSRFSAHTFPGNHLYLHEEREALTMLIANQLSVLVGALARRTAIR